MTDPRTDAPPSDADALAAVQAVIEAGPGAPLVAPDPVNVPMIRHWCRAFGESNPVYLDADVAMASAHGEQVAPPGMLGVWTMDTKRNDGGPRDQALRALEHAGYTAVVATDYEHEYHQPQRLGVRLTEQRCIEWIEGPKDTGLGRGFFIGTRYDYRDADGELVGVARMKLLKFRPRASASQAATEAPQEA